MKYFLTLILLTMSSSLLGQVTDWQKYTLEFYQELNLARTNPQDYAKIIEELVSSRIISESYVTREVVTTSDGESKINRVLLGLQEGTNAFTEAIEFLKVQEPLEPLELSVNISRGSQDHVEDLYKNNITGHISSDGKTSPMERIGRYGLPVGVTAEVLMFGPNLSPREMVVFLIVDDGVPDRGHRLNIFDPAFTKTGVACGEHPTYKRTCGANFAEGYWEDKEMDIGEVLIATDTVILNDYREKFKLNQKINADTKNHKTKVKDF
ncbi:MAG: CAP domain-containing protein [Bacteriovoracaceae bacterium]|nr:CAP domain-containing protein [Bacteriovoracaceae bacterium]